MEKELFNQLIALLGENDYDFHQTLDELELAADRLYLNDAGFVFEEESRTGGEGEFYQEVYKVTHKPSGTVFYIGNEGSYDSWDGVSWNGEIYFAVPKEVTEVRWFRG